MGFDAEWLAARQPYDDAALDRAAVQAIQDWGRTLPPAYAPVVVDLGSGTGAALDRAVRWLAPRRVVGYAVDQDATLLERLAVPDTSTCRLPTPARLVGDLLEPLAGLGGPADGTVDLVIGHALADLLPLDRLAARAAALLRPGGLVHLALAYDGQTIFEPALCPAGAAHEAVILTAFHQHMDRQRNTVPTYGGSTSGRRLGAALAAAGLEIVTDAPAIWHVRASDGPEGVQVLTWLLRFVAGAARETGGVSARDLARWEDARRSALADGTLAAWVHHRDVLACAPAGSHSEIVTPG
ncbi:MAG: hypothetical protein AB7K36_09200 [Chloroflexota bacterium]